MFPDATCAMDRDRADRIVDSQILQGVRCPDHNESGADTDEERALEIDLVNMANVIATSPARKPLTVIAKSHLPSVFL